MANKRTKNRNPQSVAAATNGATFETATRGLKGVRAARDGARVARRRLLASHDGVRAAQKGAIRIQDVAEQWKNTSPERLAGRLAEEFHAATFNVDAAAKGLNGFKAVTGASSGASTATADLTIMRGAQVVDSVQVKYHAKPAGTTFHVSDVKYDGMQRVVPSDQAPRVRELAAKRGVDRLGRRNYPAVAKTASDRVSFHGAESTPLARAEALELARTPQQGSGKLNQIARRHEAKAQQNVRVAGDLVGRRVAGAIKSGAVMGAAVGGAVSAVSNIIACAGGKKSGEDAVIDVAKDAAACAATGAAVSGVAVAAEVALFRAGVGALARGAAPVAIGFTAVEVAKDVGRFVNGDIDGEKFVKKTGANIVTGGATWGGMEGGAAIGTVICPGVGTVIGGILGGIGGALFGSWIAG